MGVRRQILIIFLSITVLAIGISTFIYYDSAKASLLRQIYNNLEAVSETKKQRMISLITKRQEQMVLLQVRQFFNQGFYEVLKDANEYRKFEIRRELQEIRNRIPSYKEIYLVAINGEVIISSSRLAEGSYMGNSISFKHALNQEICVHDVYYDSEGFLSHNIGGRLTYNGETIGVIILKTNAYNILEIINDYTGLGETGETTLAKKLPSGKTYYIAPTRFNPTLGDSIIVSNESRYAMANALFGREELLEEGYVDYRNEPVIASTRFIPEIGWGMTTKIDSKEALLPIRDILWDTLIIAGVMIALVSALAFYFADKITQPILTLTKVSNQIANGQLEKRIDYESNNEFGQLALNFNTMADSLSQSIKDLQLKIEESNRINDSLNRFAHVVSHDLKSPLIAITGLLDLLKNRLPDNDEDDKLKILGMAQYKANHMQELINGILHYSMSTTTDDQKQIVNVKELVVEVIKYLDVPDHIETIVEDLPVVHIEKILILQVFQNLIGNAIKYMDKPVGKVKIGYQKCDGYLQFYVQDNGRGIHERHYEKIFDIFNRTNRVSGIESTGLGLSIVKKIIENKGGRIWVNSEVGKGSIFYFTLPKDVEQGFMI